MGLLIFCAKFTFWPVGGTQGNTSGSLKHWDSLSEDHEYPPTPTFLHRKQASSCKDILTNKGIIRLILQSFGPSINHAVETQVSFDSRWYKTSVLTKGLIAFSLISLYSFIPTQASLTFKTDPTLDVFSLNTQLVLQRLFCQSHVIGDYAGKWNCKLPHKIYDLSCEKLYNVFGNWIWWKVIAIQPEGDMNIWTVSGKSIQKLLRPFTSKPQMSTSCCCRGKVTGSPQVLFRALHL